MSYNLKKSVHYKTKKPPSILSTWVSACRRIDVKHFTSDACFTSTSEHGYLSRSRLCIDRKLHGSSSHHTRRWHRVYLPSHQRDPHHSSYTLRTHTFLRTKRKALYIHTHCTKPPLGQNKFCELKSTQNITTHCKWGCSR